ncbi:XRE family transcriptional regulator [Streptomyces halobius]|uniref:XRE family transcriptional regulator n=1 Tax=Streptomyces halobius TaxID=2879846 RepID=A0ABY4MD84_9ACTN|nr:XRE family transcriptional regulator [Streptomyces halobius]UQA95734.1 XRE family transcriptional regulator [Streptomyces halobius]
MTKLYRKGNGQPLRDAMRANGVSGPELAERTKRLDSVGRGVSPATIGRLAGRGGTARDACRLATAWLVAEALDWPIHRLFGLGAPSVSTDTVERCESYGDEDSY